MTGLEAAVLNRHEKGEPIAAIAAELDMHPSNCRHIVRRFGGVPR